ISLPSRLRIGTLRPVRVGGGSPYYIKQATQHRRQPGRLEAGLCAPFSNGNFQGTPRPEGQLNRTPWTLLDSRAVTSAVAPDGDRAGRWCSGGTRKQCGDLPPAPGRRACRARIPSYYYDRYTQSCRKFMYGGCEGNDNNFETWEACDEACWRIESPSFCYSPKDEGLCSANVTRYYFNPRHKACEAFTYTGCGGNENNFINMKDCKHVCVKALKKEKNKKMPKLFFANRRLKIWKRQF
ncbi:LOW QUALITY PROTEIN: tissue factor pathway inhibitor 2, partial [Lynx canadensis]|uniref:LOW QUALITY PROTEIN: tissue factor pathway inhibitor 2 n=1 Tax=Lynx canadensis TaxID=61383 RepID=UPI0011B07AEA